MTTPAGAQFAPITCSACGSGYIATGSAGLFCQSCGTHFVNPETAAAYQVPQAAPGPYSAYPQPGQHAPWQTSPYPAQAGTNLYGVAVILNWVFFGLVVVATLGIGVIAAAWVVPMTIATKKAENDGRKHTALAICTLLFVNIVSGILMLVDESNRR